jgi:hypothetical protein
LATTLGRLEADGGISLEANALAKYAEKLLGLRSS